MIETIGTLLANGTQQLATQCGEKTAFIEARVLLRHIVDDADDATLIRKENNEVTATVREAFEHNVQRRLTGEPVLLIVGYGSFSPLTGSGIFWLLLIGVSATGGQLAVTRGLQRGHTPVASALLYSSIIFAGMFDYLIWDAVPDAFSWLGIALISGSGIAALYLNIKRQQA
jgi:hypothetical protein